MEIKIIVGAIIFLALVSLSQKTSNKNQQNNHRNNHQTNADQQRKGRGGVDAQLMAIIYSLVFVLVLFASMDWNLYPSKTKMRINRSWDQVNQYYEGVYVQDDSTIIISNEPLP